jgi:hypothetical protein
MKKICDKKSLLVALLKHRAVFSPTQILSHRYPIRNIRVEKFEGAGNDGKHRALLKKKQEKN